ncbi:hypothetical protein DYU05_10210 [Mucilaginibacter terrenus]|uniref:Secretion system C-terminal sorting domain-containing protein n=1 Tax=Mucilaginibacter terrenus TaxID=2482727 RepID=A0A3E2NY53_9SPHI|nr:T9SS type A sorting domain-containing protein [Mucilaginibacter terrenus]RFZ85933.1 hypothetical protein DYU05_10210 [Mucilaginibacter terrenus]
MKRNLSKLTFFLLIVLLALSLKTQAQEYYDGTNTPRQYYYNNLEAATVGSPTTFMTAAGSTSSSPATIYLKTNSSLNGSQSFSTSASAANIGYLKWNFFGSAGTAANVSLGTAAWEWEFDYKNTTGVAPNDNGTGMVAGQDSWRYWLFANAYNGQTTYGMYVTVSGTSLVLRVKYGSASNQYATFNTGLTIPANTDTYQIRIARAALNGYYHVFVLDRTTGVTTGTNMTTGQNYINVGTSNGNADMVTYNFSYLESTTSTADHFQWDNFNFYKQQVDYVPVTSSANGITTSIYPGIVDAIPYGVNVNVRGDIFVGVFVINFSGNGTNGGQALFTSGSLYKTSSSVFSKTTGTKIADVSINSANTSQVSMGNSNEYYYGAPNTDGSRTNVVNYFLLAQGRNPFYNGYSTSLSYSISNTNSDTYEQFYSVGYYPYQWSNVSSATSTVAGDVWDWTGKTSAIWTTSGAWTKNLSASTLYPQVSTDIVRIGVVAYSGGTTQPSATSSYSIGSLTFGSANSAPTLSIGGSITLSDDLTINANTAASLTGGTLNIGGDFSNGTGATFAAISSTVNFTSSSAQAITNSNTSTTPSVTFKNVNFSGGGTKTFGSGGYYSVSPTGVLKISNATVVSIPSTTTHLKFLANSGTAYAQIDQVSGSIQGNIDYQVYFTGGSTYRNYRSMAAPVYNNTTTYSTTNGTYKLADLKNSFIITGPSGSANGFDKSTNNGNTLKLYNSSTDNFSPVSSLSTAPTVATGKGFYMYFRGDRTPTGTVTNADPFGSKTNKPASGAYAVPENVTYTYTGIPNQGNISTTFGTKDNLFYFVANPYAATLDGDAVIASTTFTATTSSTSYTSHYIGTSLWTWNPSAGAFAIYDQTTPAASTNGAKRYIVPGQGFFVKANTNVASTGVVASPNVLTITESMKSTGNNSSAVRLLSTGTPVVAADPPIIRLQLAKNAFINDEIAVVLWNTAKDSLDMGDAVHMNGDYMNLTTITADNKYLSIDKRPFNGTKTVIPLYINVAVDSIYTFKKTYLSNVMSNYKVTLYDSLLNNKVEITNIDYSFNVYRAKPETWGGKRFKLIIEQAPAPVTFFEFKGKLNTDKTGLLTWKTNRYRIGTTYQVQRAPDTTSFADVGLAQYGVDTSGVSAYIMTDSTIQQGVNYYRLVQTDIFGNKSYSNYVTIKLSNSVEPVTVKSGFRLFPNPVVGSNFSVISDKTYNGKITMRIYNTSSEVKMENSFNQLNSQEAIQQNVSGLRYGVYVVELKDASNKVLTTLKFIKQ